MSSITIRGRHVSAQPSRAARPFGHAVMFHHFNGVNHPVIQGSLSAPLFERCLDCIAAEGDLLPAREWLERTLAGTLRDTDVCLSFDDCLRSQIDIALPVLQRRGLTGFWFVYSSVFEGIPEKLEIYRYFRNTQFADVADFYHAFEMALLASTWRQRYLEGMARSSAGDYLKDATYYTERDRWFRYVRDRVLEPAAYFAIMDRMLEERDYDPGRRAGEIWMDDGDLISLDREGHVIGLHSYSHPTDIAALPAERQADEYARNATHLARVLGRPAITAAHPNGSYSPATLELLGGMDIKLAFRADMAAVEGRTALEYPREDHAYVMRRYGLDG